jgi:hypothetical protein
VSEFELITITFSFVLGLGVAQILSAASAALRNRHERALHWMPLGFAASIFLFHIQYWFVLFDYDANLIIEWTWWSYGPFLALAVLLFLSGGVVLPTPGTEAGDSLISDFEQRGKLSLVFLAAYIFGWVPANAWSEGTWFTPDVWLNLGLVVLLAVTYHASNRRVRGAATGLFLAAQAYGLLFVWATPTDLG